MRWHMKQNFSAFHLAFLSAKTFSIQTVSLFLGLVIYVLISREMAISGSLFLLTIFKLFLLQLNISATE